MTDIEDVEPDDDVDLADLVAELDDEPDGEYPDDEYDGEDGEIFTGTARGGPLNGRPVESRFPKGFLLIDMEHDQVWIYDRQEDGSFKARSDDPDKILDDGPDNRWRAASEDDYDILVPDAASSDDEGGDE